MGISSVWVEDEEKAQEFLRPGTTVIAIDIWSDWLVPRPGVDYVLHNFPADHSVFQGAAGENILRLQVWSDDAFGTPWAEARAFDRVGRCLYQPWGTNLLAEEFMEPVFNQTTNTAIFVGAIWGEKNWQYGELGNMRAIDELKLALSELGLKFVHFTHIPDTAAVRELRSARLAPSVAGAWQVAHGYLPCRCFKNPSYGVLMFTNVPAVNRLFGDAAVPGTSVRELVENAVRLKQKEYVELVQAQQRVAAHYTYRESLTAIFQALEEGK